MSVKLRLTRMGNKKRSFFRIVATNTAAVTVARWNSSATTTRRSAPPTSRSTPTRCRSGWTSAPR